MQSRKAWQLSPARKGLMEAQVCNSGLFVTRERLLWAWSLEHTPGFHIVASLLTKE